MSFHIAEEQFPENIDLLGGEAALAAADPEKFNLYNTGLMNIARGLQGLQTEVQTSS